jgi:pyrimidine deaminase RibD-like protein
MSDDETFLRAAIDLSRRRMGAGFGGPFGAIVVRGGKIVAEGFNQVTSANDPTAHAEVSAIRAACTVLKTFSLAGCTLYTSCEPTGRASIASSTPTPAPTPRSSASTTITSTANSTSRSPRA